MLIPILGRAGSGKTTWILDKVEQTAKQGGRVLCWGFWSGLQLE